MRPSGPENIRDSLFHPVAIFVLAMLVVPQVTAFVLGLAGLNRGAAGEVPDPAFTGAVLAAQGIALALITLGHVTGPTGLGLPARVLGLTAGDWRRDVVLGMLAGAGMLAVNVAGSALAAWLFTHILGPEAAARHIAREQAGLEQMFQAGVPPVQLALLAIIAVVVAPVSEELFFRGYVHGVLRAHLGSRAVWATSAVFAAAHLYLVHFLPLFFMGYILTALYERRGTLVAPVVAHAAANLGVAVGLLLQR
ncbi:MAG: CPBP family intramembrane metalloprotease [Firmicutes bacterium]|nr:CPBP family intramembrane metalloprotease [Bacillota bacterium]